MALIISMGEHPGHLNEHSLAHTHAEHVVHVSVGPYFVASPAGRIVAIPSEYSSSALLSPAGVHTT